MSNAIKQMIEQCEVCQQLRVAQKKEPLQDTEATGPLDLMCTDFFQYAGKDFLVLVDRFSGYLWVDQLKRTNTAAVVDRLFQWFGDWGFPKVLRSDNGSQYRSEFIMFYDKYNITHHTSSPGNPQSNGCAENAVKQAKHLLEKCAGYNNEFLEGLLEYRNTPRDDGFSPADLFIGRRQRTQLPALPGAYKQVDSAQAIQSQERRDRIAKGYFDEASFPLPPLRVGDRVRVRHPNSTRWNEKGTIVAVREHYR